MRLWKLLLGVLAAGIVVAGCQAMRDDPQAPAKTALLTCESVNTQLAILLPMRENGVLPDTALTIIDHQIEITEPFCGGPAPDVNADYIAVTVDAAARSLGSIVATFRGGT